VTKRFYRSDQSRSTDGLGLGLSLVAAVVGGNPGCTAEIVCAWAH
jgi:signal transduction histidine kinase